MVESITYEQASELLGTQKDPTPTEILKSFKEAYDQKKNDGKLAMIPTLKEARKILLGISISGQIEKQRYFEIVSPFENSCAICRGAGVLFKFVKKSVKVNCHICAGKKEIKVASKEKCEKCNGTGRFKKKWKEGGGINVSCKFCKDGFNTKVKTVKCNNCLGTGKIEKLVLDSKIESTTPCNRCQQKGFIEPKPKKKIPKPSNPVITENLAMKIKEQFPLDDYPTNKSLY